MGIINRSNPTTIGAGVVVSDFVDIATNSKGNLRGPSSYAFAGSPTGLATAQSVAAGGSVKFNSLSLLNLGSVFPGPAVTLTITATAVAATTVTVNGYKGQINITETIAIPLGTKTVNSVGSYTSVNSIIATAALTNVIVGTNPLIVTTTLGVKQPQLAAALDMNSSSGAVLFPKATTAEIQAFDASSNGVAYASTDGMRLYNTTTNSFCEKSNGYWSGLYPEDPMKASRKKVTVFLNKATLTAIGTNTAATNYQVLPNLESYPFNNIGLGTTQAVTVNKAATLKGTMPFPAQVKITLSANAASTTIFTVTGYYNGVLFNEAVTIATISSAGQTLAKFSSVVSIVPNTTIAQTATYGYAGSSAVYVVYSAVTVFNPGSVVFTGANSLGINLVSNAINTNYTHFIELLSNKILTTSTSSASGPLVVTSSGLQEITSVNSLLGGTAMMLTTGNSTSTNIFTPGAGNCSAFVTIEYDIIW